MIGLLKQSFLAGSFLAGPLLAGPLLAGLLLTGCEEPADAGAEVEALELSDTWVFVYAEDPDASMDALHSGAAVIEEDCLLIGEAVVVWRSDQLDEVELIVHAALAGEAVTVQLGGGGLSLDEGSTTGDLPAAVLDHCDVSQVWFASSGDVEIE